MKKIYLITVCSLSIFLPALTGQTVNFYAQSDLNNFDSTTTDIVGSVYIETQDPNDPIIDLSNLSNLRSITGSLYINNNPDLTSIDALSGINSISDLLRVSNNASLLSIHFPHLDTLESLTIISNLSLVRIEGFNNLPEEVGNFGISNLMALETIDGFGNIREVGENLIFSDCPELATINAFGKLTRVGENFRVVNVDKIVDLDPFENLAFVGEELRVEDNDRLADCCAIQDLLASGNIGDGATIANNPSACSTLSEVLAGDCTVGLAEVLPAEILLYPNPVKEVLEVKNVSSPLSFSLYTPEGKILNAGMLSENDPLDLAALAPGIYLLQLTSENYRTVRKIIKVAD